MKKRCLCLLMLLICLAHLPAFGEARYTARSNIAFNLRDRPDDAARRIRLVPVKTSLEILEYGEQWCHVRIERTTGYARTRWLSLLRSLAPVRFPVPGYPAQIGIVRMKAKAFLSVPSYDGNELTVGDLVSVRRMDKGDAVVNMMREEAKIPADSFDFLPFVPWRDAEPGDIIAGFTSFYNHATGGRLAANRRLNIMLGASRIDGATLMPGNSFSFNALCGPYRKFNGYAMAPNISEDGVGYGGGVCQVSTTLYLAVLGLPVQITDWSLHRERGVDYALQGFDAAVGSYSDLRFNSMLPYEISLRVLEQSGVFTVLVARK